MTPDEKRKECGQELVEKYFNPKVAAALTSMFLCRKKTINKSLNFKTIIDFGSSCQFLKVTLTALHV